MSIKISIIVPVYNVEKYLPKCLDTLVNQTLQEIEIIVVNDGSTDHSQEIIDEFASRYSWIKALQKKNGGLSDARNFGMEYASGEYIAFVDSDDYVEHDMYELLYHKAIEDQCDMVECNLYHDFQEKISPEYGKKLFHYDAMIREGRSVVWNKIYKRSWLEQTGVKFAKGLIYEDIEFYCKLLIHKPKVAYIDQVLIHYVQRKSSINNKTTLKTMDMLQILTRIITYYKENGQYDRYKESLEFLSVRIILCSSFTRMILIDSSKDRKKALRESWYFLNKMFPKWKKNKYLKREKSVKSFYIRHTTFLSYRVIGKILPIGLKIRTKVCSMNA